MHAINDILSHPSREMAGAMFSCIVGKAQLSRMPIRGKFVVSARSSKRLTYFFGAYLRSPFMPTFAFTWGTLMHISEIRQHRSHLDNVPSKLLMTVKLQVHDLGGSGRRHKAARHL